MKTFFRDSIFLFTGVLYLIYLFVFLVLVAILGKINTFNLIMFTLFFIETICLVVSFYLNNLKFKHILYFLLSKSFNLLFPFYLIILSNYNDNIIIVIFIILCFFAICIFLYLLSMLCKKQIKDSIFKEISNYLKAEGVEVTSKKDTLNFIVPRNYPYPDGLILALRISDMILKANSIFIKVRPNRVINANYKNVEYELTFIAR